MRSFTMRLQKQSQRPVIALPEWHHYGAMLDTGALYPIWVREERILQEMGAEIIQDQVSFGGFGGEATGKLYRIPFFQLGELIYPGLCVIAHKLDLPCHMIVSATMFSKLRYEIDDENHALNVTIPDGQSNVRNLVIEDRDGQLHVFCTSGEE